MTSKKNLLNTNKGIFKKMHTKMYLYMVSFHRVLKYVKNNVCVYILP